MDIEVIIYVVITGIIKPVILLVLIVLVWFLLRKRSAALQHFVLSLGVMGALILVLMGVALSDIDLSIFPSISTVIQFPVVWVQHISGWLLDFLSARNILLVGAIYFFPVCFLMFYLFLGVVGLWYQTRRAQVVQASDLNSLMSSLVPLVGISRPIRLVISREVESPQTWGIFRPVIMLPRAALLWEEDKQLSVLIHELGHIARWDWLTTMLVKMICACFWFLIPIWWIAQNIYQQAEIACDDYIFKLRDKHVVYAKNLLAIASGANSPERTESLAMLGQSPVHQRIMAFLDKHRPHQPVEMETAQYFVICGVLLLCLLASIQLIPLQSHLQKQTRYLFDIQWTNDDEAQRVDTNKSVAVENFSWELLQRLKPVESAQPSLQDAVEVTRTSVVKPEKQELHAPVTIVAALPEIPQIQIQGYLPTDLVTPEYPAVALQKSIEGWVQVEFSVDTNGAIISPRIINHFPSAIFDRAVISALKKSRYRPQHLNGQPVIVQGVTETFRFQLSTSGSSRLRR